LEKGAARVELGWQAYRPELDAEVRAEVTVQDRQAVVVQTIRFRSPDGGGRPIRLRGPTGVTGLRGTADPVGPGEWVFRPAADAGKEVTLTLSFGVPMPPRRPADPGPHKFPVGLIWPDTATRVTASVRVWSAPGGRRVKRFEGPWRELPPEADRDAWPLLTLAGSGSGLPLAFELGDATDGVLPQVWVDRALIQAWAAEESVAVQARFLLRRWTTARLEVTLPPGVVPEIALDGRKVTDLTPDPVSSTVGVPIAEPKPGRAYAVLEVRYQLPTARAAWAETTLIPPVLSGAAYRAPARWQVAFPQDVTPLTWGDRFQPEARWGLRSGVATALPAATPQDLEQWFAAGVETDLPAETGAGPRRDAGEAVVGRQPLPGRVSLLTLPRAGWVTVCSLAALVLGVVLVRLPPAAIGPAVALVGSLVAVAAVVWPQPVAQAVAGCQPGLWAALLLLAGQVAIRWYYRRRVTHLPGFTRTRRDPGADPPAAPLGTSASATGSGSAPRLVDDPTPVPARR
jgi:hypothetical protein